MSGAISYLAPGCGGEYIQTQLLREESGGELAFDTVSRFIQRRSERSKTALAGSNRDDAAANTAFAWQSDIVKPVTGSLIHSGSRHHGQRVMTDNRIDHAPLREWIHPAIGQSGSHDRQVFRAHVQRTLFCV